MTIFNCPHCQQGMELNPYVDATKDSRMSFAITTEPGSKLQAETLAGIMQNMSVLSGACGNEHGIKTTLLVDRISMEGDVTKIDFVMVRVKSGEQGDAE